jgi:ABC-2 type transport system ATP-binding protein
MTDVMAKTGRRALGPILPAPYGFPVTKTNVPALELTGLTKRYGTLTAVDDLSITVRTGETVALLGPNGAGKSTTINVLLGLLDADAGGVRVLGTDPRQAVTRGAVGAMLQSTGLPGDVLVRELVELVRALYPRPLPFDQVVREGGLGEIAGKRIEQLSGGQVQRVKLALALAGDPSVLVLDEPTVAMDVETRRHFWDRVRAQAAAGRTVLFATHYLAEAEEYADRVVVVARGRIVADGTAAELTSRIGARTVRFTTVDPGASYAAVPGVSEVDSRGNTVRLQTDDVENTLRALLSRHDRLPDLTVTGASLEDAFVALTAETEAEAGAAAAARPSTME